MPSAGGGTAVCLVVMHCTCPRLTLAVPASCALSVLKMPSWVGVLLSFLHTGNRGSVEQKEWSLRVTNLGTGQAGLSFPRVASSLPHFWVPSLPCVTAVPSGHNCHQGDGIELLVRGQNPSRFPLAQSPWVSLGRLHLRRKITSVFEQFFLLIIS